MADLITITIRVLVICIPIFALLYLGHRLKARGGMSEAAHAFINGLVYRYSLPALIFVEVAKQDFATLINFGLIAATVLPMLATGLVFGIAAKLRGLPVETRGIVGFMPFWANLSYLGFPLARAAYGEEGMTAAAIVNAFGMPLSVIGGLYLLSTAEGRRTDWSRQLITAVTNPVVVAALAGVAVAGINSAAGLGDLIATSRLSAGLLAIAKGILDLLGSMGLPLALIAVGASLHGEGLRHPGLLAWGSLGKLVLTPALAWLVLALGFAEDDPATVGTGVLLMAMPCSVAAFVISREMRADSGLIANHLVVSTVLSVITIPLWLGLLFAIHGVPGA